MAPMLYSMLYVCYYAKLKEEEEAKLGAIMQCTTMQHQTGQGFSTLVAVPIKDEILLEKQEARS